MTENLDHSSRLRIRNQSQICRVCLITNIKMFSLEKHEFYKKYQDVTGLEISQDDIYPGFLCWECVHNLLSCHRFKSRAVLSHCLLTDLLETDKKITEQSIRKINRYKNGLVSKLKQYKNPPNYYDLKLNNEEINNKIHNEAHTNANIEITVIKNEDDDATEDEIKTESVNIKEESSDDDNDDRSFTEHDEKVIKINKNDTKPKLKTPKVLDAKTKVKSKTAKVKQKEQAESKRKATVKKKSIKKSSEYLDNSTFEISDLTLEEQISEIEKRKNSKNYIKSNFKCEKCYKGFLDESAFKFHSIRHTNQSGEHECPVCKIHFKTSKAMRHHLSSHIQKYTCKHCVFTTTRRRHAKLHADFHKGTKYKCPHCDEEFGQSSTYLSHIRIKHPSDIVCDLCGYSFISQKGLDLHKKLKHRFDEDTRPEDDYRCEDCAITFLKKEALETHLKVSPKHVNPEDKERNCGDYWSNRRKDKNSTDPPRRKRGSQSQQHQRKRDDPIQCELCDAQLANGMAYHHHFLREHPGKNRTQLNCKRAHMCEVCGKMFTTRAVMEDHKTIHGANNEKQFKCEHCGKSFLRKYALINHISRVHSAKRRIHNCNVCGKGFNSYNLKRHMLIHTGLKPFECKMCGKFFKDVAERKLHITHVHLKVPWPKRNRGSRTRKQDPSQDSEASSTNADMQPLWTVCDDPKNSLIAKSNYVL